MATRKLVSGAPRVLPNHTTPAGRCYLDAYKALEQRYGPFVDEVARMEASRTAFANVNAPGAGGQAHLYRGVSLYRKKDYTKAEQEFASALNFDSGPSTQDATAWRHMAAVAAGACGPSAGLLEQAMPNTSSLFPKDEAEGLLKQCQARSISEVVHPPTQ